MYLSNSLKVLSCTLALSRALTPDCFDSAFKTTFAFTATIQLGQPSNASLTNPITTPGGIIVAEPIIGGTVSGPLLNASITGGLATPRVYLNNTLQEPVIDLYGITSSGVPLSVHEEGIGSPTAQVTRIVVNIGSGHDFDPLRNGYILASVNPTSDRKTVNVKAFLVENIVGSSTH